MITLSDCLTRFDDTLAALSEAFRSLEAALPQPSLIQTRHGWSRRYETQCVEHALIMKFARLISITSALRHLVAAGHAHEQGILQRAADETGEDIYLLFYGKQNGLKAIHRKYLKHFWREEFEAEARPSLYRPRHTVHRGEVRDYIAAQTPYRTSENDRMVYGVYSGFVHGASTHIYDLIDLESGRYRLAGVADSLGNQGYLGDALNYPLRALMAGVPVARALGETETANELLRLSDDYLAWLAAQNL